MKKEILTLILFCMGTVAIAQTVEEADSLTTDVMLDEVVVTAKKPTTKFTDTGLVYDMKADPATRTMSLLEALRHVPMVTVSADDEIRVKGSTNYSIYLNGRPYRVAQTDPKAVLGSIPANTIAKIELITELDGRYDAEAGSAIINIITVKNALDGYSITLNGRVNTKPEHERIVDATNDGISLLATKGRVNIMLGYDYTWQNVFNQPMSSKFSFYNQAGNTVSESTTTLRRVDGNYNFHTGRLMLEWTPDSLNSLYVDGHAFFDHHYVNAVSQRVEGDTGVSSLVNYSRSYQSNTSGTAEANIIYRNYYRNHPGLCRFSLGYRYALDPEKAMSDFTVSDDEECKVGERSLRRVNGHLQEHTINADYALPLGSGHTLRVGAKDIIRLGKTQPEYLLVGDDELNPLGPAGNSYDGAMNYDQNISALYAAYNGRVKDFNLSASLRGEYSHNSFNLLGEGKRYSYEYLDLIPRVSILYNPSPTTRYTLTYNTSVSRPGIGELDPFLNIYYGNFMQQGNPDLRQSRTHSLNLAFLNMSQKLVMQATASANRCVNPIVDYYVLEPETCNVVRTSINFGRRDFLGQSIYMGYRPKNWLSITLAGAVTENWFSDKKLGKSCFGIDWNLYLAADFTLPRSWVLGAQLMCNHQFADPYSVNKSTSVVPAFYANKNFFDGKLSVGLTLSSPFSQYIHFKSAVNTPEFSKIQRNEILSRGIALNVSYRFDGGKKTHLDRDTSLRNDDLPTGVK